MKVNGRKTWVNGEKGMRRTSAMWAGTGQHACLAEPCTSSLSSALSYCYTLFLNISCVTSLSTWREGKWSQCQIHRSGCQKMVGSGCRCVSPVKFSHLCPCAYMCLHVWACFSLDYMFILAPGQTYNWEQQQPASLGWNRIFYWSELMLHYQPTIHFLFQITNENRMPEISE